MLTIAGEHSSGQIVWEGQLRLALQAKCRQAMLVCGHAAPRQLNRLRLPELIYSRFFARSCLLFSNRWIRSLSRAISSSDSIMPTM